MGNPNTGRRKLPPTVPRALQICREYCVTLWSRLTSLLVLWALVTVRFIVRALYSLDAKLNQQPVSLDLLVLQNMLDIAETLPRFQLQSNMRKRSSSQPILRQILACLCWIISIPVKAVQRLACRVLQSLYRLDQKLHQRTPRILSVLKSTLDDTEHTLRFVQDLKSRLT